jgi:arylsulfatase
LVLFLSDNGADANPEGATKDVPPGPKESAHIYGRPWANLSNTPLRGYKHAMYEGGIATPLVAYWPREITKPGVTHAPGHVIDLMATCLDIGECDYPTGFGDSPILPLEGRSLRPIFADGARPGHDALFWEHEGNRAVMSKSWKLVADHGRPWELYDLATDRTELHDLATSRPEVVADLAAKYDAWAARTGVLPWDDVRRAIGKK